MENRSKPLQTNTYGSSKSRRKKKFLASQQGNVRFHCHHFDDHVFPEISLSIGMARTPGVKFPLLK
jgi:hypothetical protein